MPHPPPCRHPPRRWSGLVDRPGWLRSTLGARRAAAPPVRQAHLERPDAAWIAAGSSARLKRSSSWLLARSAPSTRERGHLRAQLLTLRALEPGGMERGVDAGGTNPARLALNTATPRSQGDDPPQGDVGGAELVGGLAGVPARPVESRLISLPSANRVIGFPTSWCHKLGGNRDPERGESMTELLSIILAAGEGTRMRSALPKVLHEVGGLPIVGHVVRTAVAAGRTTLAVVIGPGHDAVQKMVAGIAPQVASSPSPSARVRRHAVRQAARLQGRRRPRHRAFMPITRCCEGHTSPASRTGSMLAATPPFSASRPADPTGYGRLITEGDRLLAIREHKDATDDERAIGLCNACILAFRAEVFRTSSTGSATNNAQGEFYLTDCVELANAAAARSASRWPPSATSWASTTAASWRGPKRSSRSCAATTSCAPASPCATPATVYFSYDTEIGRDVTIEPNVVFGPGVTVGDGRGDPRLLPHRGRHDRAGARSAPSPGSAPGPKLADGAHVGNFVEIKKAKIGEGAKVNHLTYIGDADVGAKANIGAGTITCNYDGVTKHQDRDRRRRLHRLQHVAGGPGQDRATAPITASGTVITRTCAPDALALARARQDKQARLCAQVRARAEAMKAESRKGGA